MVVLVDPEGGVGSAGNTSNAFFGLHMANNPNWKSSKCATRTYSPNFIVCNNLVT
jgi:hypothetical protein